jgi:hypothetical protein
MGERLLINQLGQWTVNGTWGVPSLSKSDIFYDDLDLFEPMEVLQKVDKNVLYQMMGDTAAAKDAANWARKTLQREDLVLWFARAYKQDPSIDTPTSREQLQHYVGMTHLPTLGALRLTKEHDFDSGMAALADAERQDVAKQKEGMIPAGDAKKVVDAGNGLAWYSLGKGYCANEGKAMGHCGNVARRPGDDILSLRSSHTVGGEEMHRPYVTFINNGGYLGEMKGRGNDKPSPKYHSAIMKLLTSPEAGIKHVVGGGYLPENNFHVNDLSPQHQAELAAHNPNINLLGGGEVDLATIPAKFQDVAARHNAMIQFANTTDTDPKALALTLNALYRKGSWDDKKMAEDFARSPKMTPEVHIALKKINKAHGNHLLTMSPHFSDDDARELLLNTHKHPIGSWNFGQLLKNKAHLIDNNQIEQILNRAKSGHLWHIASTASERGVTPSKATIDKMMSGSPSAMKATAQFFPQSLTREHAEKMMAHPSISTVRALARAEAPYAVKAGLENHEDREVRHGMAHSTADLPPEILDKLSKDPHAWVRNGVSRRFLDNPVGLPDHLFDRMANDRSKHVRRGLFGWSREHDKITPQAVDKYMSQPKNIKDTEAMSMLLPGHQNYDGTPHKIVSKLSPFAIERLVTSLENSHPQVEANRQKWLAARAKNMEMNGLTAVDNNWPEYYKYHPRQDNWITHGGINEGSVNALVEHPHFNAEHAARLSKLPHLMEHLETVAAKQPQSEYENKHSLRTKAALTKIKTMAQPKP